MRGLFHALLTETRGDAPKARRSVTVVMRLFVALWPSEDAVERVDADLDPLRPRHPELRWQPPERWHLTLAFLGERDLERTERTLDRVLTDPRVAEPIRTRGAGHFGPTLWLGVQHEGWLTGLARDVQRGLHVTDRFRAHVTVARGRGPAGRAIVKAAADTLADHSGPSWIPYEVTLVASVTGPQPRYTVQRSWPLG